MIPVSLKIAGFLSYRKPVELDFTTFDLACISGPNGSGKSSLLDAITWVLFGQARRRDDSIINSHVQAAEVLLEFQYEGSLYRVQRSKSRDKSAILEFFIQDSDSAWRPLTERTLRETEERIRSTLRMDYDTFINASFFLQGKADQFAQQRPGERKRILSNVLGLEAWELYQERVSEHRKKVELQLSEISGSISEIDSELLQEESRRQHFEQISRDLAQLAELSRTKEKELEYARRLEEGLSGQRKMLELKETALRTARARLEERNLDLQSRRSEAEAHHQQIAAASEIVTGYHRWQKLRRELETWDLLAANFHEVENRRRQPLLEIETTRTRLEQELDTLRRQEKDLETQVAQLDLLQAEEEQSSARYERLLNRLGFQQELEKTISGIKEGMAALKVENRTLAEEGGTLNERIAKLEHVEGAECPLCGQPLEPLDRERLLVSLVAQRDEMRQRFASNRDQTQELETRLESLTAELAGFDNIDNDLRQAQRAVDQARASREQIAAARDAWQSGGALRLQEIERMLSENRYSLEARALLVEIDASSKSLGYDVEAHDRTRREEQQARVFETRFMQLETARAALEPLQREISNIEKQAAADVQEIRKLEEDYAAALKRFELDSSGMPDLLQVETEFYEIRERENRMRTELGGARQKVEILDQLRLRRRELSSQGEEIRRSINQLKTLERALGKDGVPALLIEQALPEIEIEANEILDRLSGGAMSVRFATQKDFKDKNREDKKETLDILISDSSGDREYELFSGGEAFRINFAIRLALSRVLSQRAGARLQTLVIDEGFGSQDAEGRQRLIEAINLVRPDFAKILVITHLEELKEAFPARIEVQKTSAGSEVRVMI